MPKPAKEKVILFGYATLAEKDYIKALVGKVPPHFQATLSGYELRLQRFDEMPDLVKKVSSANWKPEEFNSYFARKTTESNEKIKGVAWVLDKGQERVLDDWEFKGLWYDKKTVEITDNKGKKHSAVAYIINKEVGEKVPETYRPFPVDKEKMLKLAKENNLAAREKKQ